ncbi:MAG TPA: winged helix-turn-helix domain-containing protein [Candidatus Dormibacteraeota bacterium]
MDSWRLYVNDPQKLLDAARKSCDRSRVMIEESRSVLVRHRTLMAALRASASGSDDASADGMWRPALELDDEYVVGSLRLLPLRRAVTGERARVLLTPAEWQLLAALLSNRSTILSRSELATKAWGAGFAHRHGEVEVYVSRLRRKLARAGGSAHIQTFRGQGYRFSLDGVRGVKDEPASSAPAADGAA